MRKRIQAQPTPQRSNKILKSDARERPFDGETGRGRDAGGDGEGDLGVDEADDGGVVAGGGVEGGNVEGGVEGGEEG